MRVEPVARDATPPTMEPRLKKLDASAGAPKTCLALSIPIASAESETSQDERIHDPRQVDGQLELAGHGMEPAAQDFNERPVPRGNAQERQPDS